jgi:GntR family transcriptional regulator
VLAVGHLPSAIAPGLLAEDLTHQSLYALLEQKYGVVLRHGLRSVEASVANAELARSLSINEGDAVLVLRSTVYGENDVPVEMFVAYHRGDRSRFEVHLNRDQTAPTQVRPLMHVTT